MTDIRVWVDGALVGPDVPAVSAVDHGLTVGDGAFETAKIDSGVPFAVTRHLRRLDRTMAGLGLLTVLSLLWMPRRVHSRGRFGRKASVALRSLYPILLGLGGWFGAVLVVQATRADVPLDDVRLAVLSMGVPIGLGLYFAWVNRDWSATTKWKGFAAATGGALVGAWLGFNAGEGLIALVTTIVGAAVGGNLILLVLDISWDRRVRDRFAVRRAKETLEPRPSIG
jgi:hypothetical protein